MRKRPTPVRRPAEAPPRLQNTVRLSADGLAKVLGDLEARVLQTVWAFDTPVPARTVYERVIAAHPVSPLTVITVLNKLVDKRILRRARRGDLLHYSARLSEAEFVAHASRRVVEGILSFRPDAVAASMVDVLAERDPAQLAELARLVRRKMREAAPEAASDSGSDAATSDRSAAPPAE